MGIRTAPIIAVVLFAALSGCNNSGDRFEYRLQGELSSGDIPVDIGNAVVRLSRLVPNEARAAFIQCGVDIESEYCRDFGVRFELKLLRNISNFWMRPASSPLADAYRASGIEDPEIMASSLVGSYVESLQMPE